MTTSGKGAKYTLVMNKRAFKSAAAWVLLGAFVLAIGYQERARSYSCHLCRNTKTEKTTRFFWVPVSSSSKISRRYVVSAGHQHDWFGYSNYEMLGVRGLVSMRLGCSSKMYRDDKMPGYDVPEPPRN